ncbi:MAG: hypothetical protein PHC43_00170 [Candidatus Marinimicrobia bacterium]|jgi:hypothetical protein|nr:hypothetical protein [Candidatus Neomarinimicrobiota bacterium]
MSWETVASGGTGNFNQLPYYEAEIDEEQRGRLEMSFEVNVPSSDINSLKNSLEVAGVTDLQLVSGGKNVTIYYRKGFLWMPVIVAAVAAALAGIMIYLILWKLSKEVSSPVFNLAVIGGSLLAIGIAYFIFKRY